MEQLRQGLIKRGTSWILDNLPLLLYTVICIYQISFFQLEDGDYLGFQNELNQYGTLHATLSMRWETWSSRVLIDSIVYSLINFTFIWRILTLASFVLTFYSLNSLVKERLGRDSGWVVLALLLCYPLVDMNGAGWFATMPNYFWPLSCALYVLLSCARDLEIVSDAPRFIPRWAHLIRVISLALFAASMELLAAAMTAVLALALYWGIKHGKRISLIVLCLAASCVGIAFTVLCPGNAIRLAAETQTWWPTYASLSFFEKIILGLGSTIGEYLSGTRHLLLILGIILSASILSKKGVCPASVLSLALPLILLAIPEMLRRGLIKSGPLVALTLPDFGGEGMGHALPAVSAVIVALIVVEGFLVYGTSWRYAAFIGIGGAGLATRVAMGLSPTLFGSGDRTFLFCDFALIGLSLMLMSDYSKRFSKMTQAVVFSIAIIYCAFCAVNTMESIWSLSV